MEVVTSTMTAIKKMIHANARRAPPARLFPPLLLSLPDVGEGESSVGKPPCPLAHVALRALLCSGKQGRKYVPKALILPPLKPHDDINLP